MDSLPDAIVQYIMSHISDTRDVVVRKCVSKKWQEAMTVINTLYFPRNSFNDYSGKDIPDHVVRKMVSAIAHLEQLIVFSPFSSAGLASWLVSVCSSLKHLNLRMDNLVESLYDHENLSKLDCISTAIELESLTIWVVVMINPPRWDVLPSLRCLEIAGAKLKDHALSAALRACPNLRKLQLLACEGVESISFELPHLEHCKLDFFGSGYSSISLDLSKDRTL